MTCSHRSFISAAQRSVDLELPTSSNSQLDRDTPAHDTLTHDTLTHDTLTNDTLTNDTLTGDTLTHDTAKTLLTSQELLVAPGFQDACRRIDEVAEVIRPSVPSPHSDLSIQGARNRKARMGRRGHYRTSGVVW